MRMVRFAIHMAVPASKWWHDGGEEGLEALMWKTKQIKWRLG